MKEKREKKERVLIFSSREICYCSGNFFAHQLAAAFEELGFVADVCELSPDDDLDAALMPFLAGNYRIAVDFNSMLPRMELEEGERYLEQLHAPFFDYILDHPLFHYTGLTSGVKNLHAVVLDEAQEMYVRTYYPKVATVHTLPLGATEAIYQGEKETDCRILFTGTYEDPDLVYALVKEARPALRDRMERLIERRVGEPLIPMERALEDLLAEQGTVLRTEQFALCMNEMYAVDAYIRNYFRKIVLDELLECGVPVTVMGEGWEKYRQSDEHSLRRERGVPFGLSFERIAKAHILLNVAPIFNHGMHDRIAAGLANHTVVLTDNNPYLERNFQNGRELSFYSLTKKGDAAEQGQLLLENKELRHTIAAEGYEKFLTDHTWKKRAEQLLVWADRVSE